MSRNMLRLLPIRRTSARAALIAGLVGGLAFGCGKDPESPDPPPTASAPERADGSRSPSGTRGSTARAGSGELADLRVSLDETQEQNRRLARELAELEEAHATLELELRSALEELLRSQANLRNVQSRAFAVSRIAEVRVELQTFRESKDPALASRIERADEFLMRADSALAESNVGGAAYLADRAGELLRQVRTVAEIRSRESRELIPIVPPRWVEVQTQANLRVGPGADQKRLGTLDKGAKVRAMARQGEWYQVATDDGGTAWIYRRLVR